MKNQLPSTYQHPITDTLFLDMVLVKPGRFIMGSEAEDAYKDEAPEHIVEITKPYYISKYPVSQSIWQAIMKDDLSTQFFKGLKRPVTNVSWIDICIGNQDDNGKTAFLKEIKNTSFITEHNFSFQLPTEAQWEYAAKGGHFSPQEDLKTKKAAELYNPFAGSKKLKEVAWFNKNSHSETKDIGQKKSNALNLYDMCGNVWEWCYDWFDSGFYQKSKDCKIKDPCNLEEGQVHVMRGGSWNGALQNSRVSSRHGSHPSRRHARLGFRLVLSSPV